MTDPEITILKELLGRESGFVSGSFLAEKLNMTRVGVWTHMEKLREQGFQFEAVRSRGYRLTQRPESLNPLLVQALLPLRSGRPDLLFYDSVDSTNSEAERLLASGRATPFIVLAKRQLQGRGRFGRTWFSSHGENIYVSFVFRPRMEPVRMQTFTLWMGLNVCELLSNFCRIQPGIKWPNDILFGQRKVGGMLTEARIDADHVRDLVFGLGLNVNSGPDWPRELGRNATSLKEATGQPIDINRLTAALVIRALSAYDHFVALETSDFMPWWRKYDILNNQPVRFRQGDRAFAGTAAGIDSEGSLLIRMPNGSTSPFRAGEVTLEKEPSR